MSIALCGEYGSSTNWRFFFQGKSGNRSAVKISVQVNHRKILYDC